MRSWYRRSPEMGTVKVARRGAARDTDTGTARDNAMGTPVLSLSFPFAACTCAWPGEASPAGKPAPGFRSVGRIHAKAEECALVVRVSLSIRAGPTRCYRLRRPPGEGWLRH